MYLTFEDSAIDHEFVWIQSDKPRREVSNAFHIRREFVTR